MDNYVDRLMTNNFIDSDSEEFAHLYSENINRKNYYGGKPIRQNNMPSGGFPPIIIIENKLKEQEKDKEKKRFFSVSNDNKKLSIKDILSKKL